MEDGIIGAQTDYRVSPDLVEEYEFEHMLRKSLNDSWGVVLKDTPIAANDSVLVSSLCDCLRQLLFTQAERTNAADERAIL